jgi:hypothetical protein
LSSERDAKLFAAQPRPKLGFCVACVVAHLACARKHRPVEHSATKARSHLSGTLSLSLSHDKKWEREKDRAEAMI